MIAPYLIIHCKSCGLAHELLVVHGPIDSLVEEIECRCPEDGKVYEYSRDDVECYPVESSTVQ